MNTSNNNKIIETSTERMGANKRRRSTEIVETDCWWLIEDYYYDTDEGEEEEEELLELLSLQVNSLSQSVNSLKRSNDELAHALCDLQEENNQLVVSGPSQSRGGFDISAKKPPMTAFEFQIQGPSKRARRVSLGDDDDLVNSTEVQKLIFTDLEDDGVSAE
jgi:hypothetical protein